MVTGFNKAIVKMSIEDLYVFGIDLGRFLAAVNHHLSPDEIGKSVETFLQSVSAGSFLDQEEIRNTFVLRVRYGYALEINL